MVTLIRRPNVCVSGTPHGSGPSLNRSQAPTPTSSTTNHQYSTPQRDQSFSGRSGALRPKTLPLGTPPGSPGPPPRPKDAYYHTPQRNNKTLQDSPSRPLSSLQRTPSGDNPRGDSDTLGGGSCPSRHSNSASKPLHVQVDGVGVARVDGTPAGAASSSAAAAPHPPPRFSPLKVTQYDKDVAVYKGPEPPSQVSSSTDSGYGHAHIYEKMSADTSSSLSSEWFHDLSALCENPSQKSGISFCLQNTDCSMNLFRTPVGLFSEMCSHFSATGKCAMKKKKKKTRQLGNIFLQTRAPCCPRPVLSCSTNRRPVETQRWGLARARRAV